MNLEKPSSNRDTNFEFQKRKFFSNFALKHLKELRLHREFGLLIKKEGWRNVSEHCLVEAVAVDTLAQQIGLSEEKRQQLATAALLHDFYKRKEKEAAKQSGFKAYNQATGQSKEILRLQFSEETIRLSESVGHTSLQRMRESDVTLPEKIMHYIDDITAGDNLVRLKNRIDALESNSDYKELNESGRKIFGGKTYFEVQREVGAQIEKELADSLDITPQERLPDFLNEKIYQRITESE